jgi:hypothetical protein
MAVQGISCATGYALQGVRRSIDRFEAAATNVVRSSAEAFDTAQFSSAAIAKATGSQGPAASLERGLVDQRLALHELKANIAVIRTADEVADTLTHLGAPSKAQR